MEGLQCIPAKSTELSVVGTEYGPYRFNLRPIESGEYHELTCIGMDYVTAKFRKYKVDDISKEYLLYCNSEQKMQAILPRTVGGSEVHLLLGIKNTQLDPVLLKILPFSVGVYLS